MFTASAKADYPPEVVDRMGNPVINRSEVYSGMYGRVNVTFFPYAFGAKKGIGCGLGPVQKLRDGEPLGGSRVSAAQAFGVSHQTPPAYGQPFGDPQQVPPANAAQAFGDPAYTASPRGVNPITGMPY